MFKKLIGIITLFFAGIPLAFAGLIFGEGSIFSAGTFYAGPTLAYESISATDIRFEAFDPRLTAGYRKIIGDSLFAAGETFFGWRVGSMVNHKKNGRSFKNTYSYGFSFLPGIILDPWVMGYLRLGGIVTHFKATHNDRLGAQFGVGLEAMVTDTWNIRGEYDYNVYTKISRAGTPKEDQYSISLIYKFGCSRISLLC